MQIPTRTATLTRAGPYNPACMRPAIILTALLLLAAADPREPLIGHWTGTSICTGVRPACHDETASYWMKAGKAPDVVTVDFCKNVNGTDVLMGTNDCHVDFAAHTLTTFPETSEGRFVWSFTWSGAQMTGTSKSPSGQVVRNIHLMKAKS